jgi:DNA repair protein RadC
MKKTKKPPQVHLKIKDWPEDERPREKLLKNGPGALSDGELLALLIGSGTDGFTAVDVAKSLIAEVQGLSGLASGNVYEFSRMKGIGPARAARIAAAFEIGRRASSSGGRKGAKMERPEDVAGLFGPLLRDLPAEEFRVLLLDGANRVLHDEKVTQGTLNASLAHPREVFKTAVDHRAAGIILLHNHPSGEAAPSAEDRRITDQFRRAGADLGIPVLDHVIVAGNGYFSFAKEGLLKP